MELLREILDFRIVEFGGTPVTVGSLLGSLLVVLFAYILSRTAQRVTARAMSERKMAGRGTLIVVQRLLHYTIMLVGMGIALDTVGFKLGTLFAAGAIFAVGLGFAMQNIAQNFVSGIILLIERSIKPDDVLEVQGLVVRVIEMGIRSTLARTRDDEELIVPNSVLVQSSVKNYTLRDSVYRLRASVGVVYGSDMKLVLQTLTRVAERIEWRNQEYDPRVLMTAFGSSSVDFDVSLWIDDPWLAPMRRSELLQAIWWALKDVGVVIAFPQLDLHLDPPVMDSLHKLAQLPRPA